jgi:REP element-mobilizing transposase RayT
MDDLHRHRRSIRLKGYDYTQQGAYFVTICTRQRDPLLGQIEAGAVILSLYGEIVAGCWYSLRNHFSTLDLDAFVVMPDHIHGVIVITKTKGCSKAPSSFPRGTQPGSLGAILQSFKALSTRKINQARSTSGRTVWQRNYYEQIIRDEAHLAHIRRYIAANPGV